jgi:hypothetical protein
MRVTGRVVAGGPALLGALASAVLWAVPPAGAELRPAAHVAPATSRLSAASAARAAPAVSAVSAVSAAHPDPAGSGSSAGPATPGASAISSGRAGSPTPEGEPERSVSNSIVIGSDPQRPGAGVVSVETVRTEDGTLRSAPVGRPRRCGVYSVPAFLVWALEGLGRHATGGGTGPVVGEVTGPLVAGQLYHLQCRYVDDGNLAYLDSFVYEPGVSGPRVDALARQVYEEVPLVFPEPHTAPPLGAEQLVGFPVWLWVDGTVWRRFEASAGVAGVSVTVVADPREVRWDMGDGTVLTCGPGTPWDPAGPAGQRTDCAHTYQFVSDGASGGTGTGSGTEAGAGAGAGTGSGTYAASVTVVWSVTWSASTGETGTLPAASRTTRFEVDVTERQAVVSYGTGDPGG